MSERTTMTAEAVRLEALAKQRAGEIEESIKLYDAALALTDDEVECELITINKADAMIQIERTGPEVHALPSIVMRRRKPRHTFLAAYALVFKFRLENELKRAGFYGELALKCADEAGEAFWKSAALNELGSVYEIDSEFEKAIDCFHRAAALIEQFDDPAAHRVMYGAALQNLGASMILNDQFSEGIAWIKKALPSIDSPTYIAEAYIDLCQGYAGLEQYDDARHWGEEGLELATEARQVRNAHYLLGEVYYKLDDLDRAEFHFDQLAAFYPEFRNLKNLLFAIDLRSVVNFKL